MMKRFAAWLGLKLWSLMKLAIILAVPATVITAIRVMPVLIHTCGMASAWVVACGLVFYALEAIAVAQAEFIAIRAKRGKQVRWLFYAVTFHVRHFFMPRCWKCGSRDVDVGWNYTTVNWCYHCHGEEAVPVFIPLKTEMAA